MKLKFILSGATALVAASSFAGQAFGQADTGRSAIGTDYANIGGLPDTVLTIDNASTNSDAQGDPLAIRGLNQTTAPDGIMVMEGDIVHQMNATAFENWFNTNITVTGGGAGDGFLEDDDVALPAPSGGDTSRDIDFANMPLIFEDGTTPAITLDPATDVSAEFGNSPESSGDQSVFQSQSDQNNFGSIETPWVYTRGMEVIDDRTANSTAIILGDGRSGTAPDRGMPGEVNMYTNGGHALMLKSDQQLVLPEYADGAGASNFNRDDADDLIMTINPTNGEVHTIARADLVGGGGSSYTDADARDALDISHAAPQTLTYTDASDTVQTFDASNPWRDIVSDQPGVHGTTNHIYFNGADTTADDATAFVGIGWFGLASGNEPQERLHVRGNILATGAVHATSDGRLKTNIESFDGSLDAIMNIEPVTYEWLEESSHDAGTHVGFIAQNVLAALPEAVKTADDDMGTLSVSDRPILAAAVGAVQELKAENDALKAQLEDMKSQMETMELLQLAVMNMQAQLNELADENAILKANFSL